MTDRYLEDFAVGQTYGSSERPRVEQERIMAFAAEFDPQPFHLDEEAARNSIFGGLAASGWYTAAATMRMLVEGDLRPAGGILGLGFEELRWPRPVRPGDELHIESEVVEVRPSQSRPDRGLVKVRTTTLNQHGEAVQIIVGSLLVPRRSTSGRSWHPLCGRWLVGPGLDGVPSATWVVFARPRVPQAVGAENPVMSCDLDVLVGDAADWP